MLKKTVLFLLAFFICLPSAWPAQDPGVSDKEIKLGSSSALGGQASFLGTQLTQGSMAYFNEINASGGVAGRKITLVTLDDQYDPPKTLANTEKLIQDKVFMLFDYVGTPTSKVIIRLVNQEKIPLVGLFTGAEFLRNPFQPYIFNIRASYFKEAETIVDWWVGRGKKRIAAFIQDDAFGKTVLAGVNLALSRHNLTLAGTSTIERGKMPTAEEVKLIADSKPDAVVMVGTYKPLANFVKMAKDAGLKDAEFDTVSFVGSEAFAKELLALPAGTEKGVFVTQVVPSPYSAKGGAVQEFTRLYKKYYPQEEPNYVAMEGFINAKVLVEAFKRCGKNLTREKLITTLEHMSDYDAGTGLPCTISPDSHTFFSAVRISTIKGKRFEEIK